MPSLLCIKRILTLLLIASALVSVSACGQASAGPAFTKEEAIKRATEDAKLSVPEMGIQEGADRQGDGGAHHPGGSRSAVRWREGSWRYQHPLPPCPPLPRPMAARVQRQEMAVLGLLSDGFRKGLETGQ